MKKKWNQRFLSLAKECSTWSRDPSSKVGAVIVRPDKTIASIGYNGFPRGVIDCKARYEDREVKLKYVVHAETNAIVTAREPLDGYTIYTYPFPPCNECAKLIIQSGIKNVVAPGPMIKRFNPFETLNMFYEAGVNIQLVE